jgi:magnesium-transporting ATPase (P-type)
MKKAIFYCASAILYVVIYKEFAEERLFEYSSYTKAHSGIVLFVFGLLPMITLFALSLTAYQKNREKNVPPNEGNERDYNQQLWAGDIAMPSAFWFSYLLSVLATAAVVWFAAKKFNTSPSVQAKIILTFALLCVFAYQALAARGVWRSAHRYVGLPVWAASAKVAVLLLLGLVVLEFFILMFFQ